MRVNTLMGSFTNLDFYRILFDKIEYLKLIKLTRLDRTLH